MHTEPIVQQLTSMRNYLIYYSITGKYKEYAALRKEFAKNYIAHIEEAKKIPAYKDRFSIFSSYGFNIMKVMFLDMFRKKSPEEKQLKQLSKEYKAKQKAKIYA